MELEVIGSNPDKGEKYLHNKLITNIGCFTRKKKWKLL